MSQEKENSVNKVTAEKEEVEYTQQEIKKLFEKAQNQTVDTIADFIRETMDGRNQTYSSVVTSIAACAIAAAYAADNTPQGGITGFQAGGVMWQFIHGWNHMGNKTGMRLVDFDNMLYPQYKEDFDKVIPTRVWEGLQKEAKNNLVRFPDSPCKTHWQGIVDGNVPFGYKVKSD